MILPIFVWGILQGGAQTKPVKSAVLTPTNKVIIPVTHFLGLLSRGNMPTDCWYSLPVIGCESSFGYIFKAPPTQQKTGLCLVMGK